MSKSRKLPPPPPAPAAVGSVRSDRSVRSQEAASGNSRRLELTRLCIFRVMHDVGFVAIMDIPDLVPEAREWLRIADSGAPDAVAQVSKRLHDLMAAHIKYQQQLERFPCDQIADAYVYDIAEVK